MAARAPRIVLVTRKSEYQTLLKTHGTRGQAAFFLSSRDQSIDDVQALHDELENAITKAKASFPNDWSFAHADRDMLDRFLFDPNDIIVALGQDGLVANLAKYISGQPVIGVSPNATHSEGVLTPHSLSILPELVIATTTREAKLLNRSMLKAHNSDGPTLYALNELFIGHKSHQSARYIIKHDGAEEFQSSSGIIVSSGTGLTGWAKSIMQTTGQKYNFDADLRQGVFFAREPWPSNISSTDIASGIITDTDQLQLFSRINSEGVIFADGIEQDYLPFNYGTKAKISIAKQTLRMVLG